MTSFLRCIPLRKRPLCLPKRDAGEVSLCVRLKPGYEEAGKGVGGYGPEGAYGDGTSEVGVIGEPKRAHCSDVRSSGGVGGVGTTELTVVQSQVVQPP